VLYVAATRAERSLHLLGAVKRNSNGESKPAAGTFLAMLWPIVQPYFSEENLSNSLQQDHLQQSNQSAIKDFIPRLIRLPELKLAQAFASQPSAPQTDANKPATSVILNHAESVNDDPQSIVVSGLGIDIGTLTHRYLQLIAEQGLSRWTSELLSTLQPAMRAWFSSQGYSAEVAQQAAHKVQSLLTSALNHAQIRWLLEPHPEAQCEYTLEQVQADGTVKRWVIDRTFVSDGARWIVDYKTDSLMENQTSQQLAESYRPQLQNYAQLFAQQAQPIKLAVVLLSVPEMVFL
jgi:ATP-dependent exoDNAse (exonuclease V) beta subunit